MTSRTLSTVNDFIDSLGSRCGNLGIRRRIAAFSGKIARRVTLSVRQDLLLAQLGASPSLQIAVLPGDISDLVVEQFLLIETDSIKWGGRPPRRDEKTSGLAIIDGDWDTCCRVPIDTYLRSYVQGLSIHELFVEGRPYTETTQYSMMVELLKRGKTPKACVSTTDIHAYFDRLCRTYCMIRYEGYKSQVELGTGVPHDEIQIYVDRNGELHKQQGGGHHRLAIARFLKVKHVPVFVLGVHKCWIERCHQRFGGDVISALRRGLLELSVQPSQHSASDNIESPAPPKADAVTGPTTAMLSNARGFYSPLEGASGFKRQK